MHIHINKVGPWSLQALQAVVLLQERGMRGGGLLQYETVNASHLHMRRCVSSSTASFPIFRQNGQYCWSTGIGVGL